MGPRLGRVEYWHVGQSTVTASASFNGATLRTRGIRAELARRIVSDDRFNGATLRTRGIPKYPVLIHEPTNASMGPRLGRVEYRCRRSQLDRRREPLQWGHA